MKPSNIKKGMKVWIPCEVRGGPFPNERRVYVKTGLSEWFGFVSTSELKQGVLEGHDSVRGVVADVSNDNIVIGIRGQSPSSGAILTPSSLIANDTVQA